MKRILSAFFMILITSGCANTNPITRTELIFDTPVTIAIYDKNSESILTEAFSVCKSIEQRFSKTIEASEVTRINNSGGEKIEVSDELVMLLETAEDFSEITDGLFDITTYTLTETWDFKSTTPSVPEQEQIDAALETVGYENILIEGNSVTLLNDAKIDLGGIAKGYAADEVKTYLLEQGVKHATINIGGNVITVGTKYNGEDWTVGIREPFKDENTIMMSVEVCNLSVVTSGPYERNFVVDEEIYHHILNPKTGYPAESDIVSVTIITERSIIADSLSTSCYLIGVEKSVELIEEMANTEAIFVDENGEIITTSGIGDTIVANYYE